MFGKVLLRPVPTAAGGTHGWQEKEIETGGRSIFDDNLDHQNGEIQMDDEEEEEQEDLSDKPGQVPTSLEGQEQDLYDINLELEEAIRYAVKKKLINERSASEIRPFTLDDIREDTCIGTFSLSVPEWAETIPSAALLKLPRLIPPKKMQKIQSASFSFDLDEPMLHRCPATAANSATSNSVKPRALYISSLRTALRNGNRSTVTHRWLDSNFLDALCWIYLMMSPLRHVVNLNSSSEDPPLEAMRQMKQCVDKFASILYYRNHWTVVFIDHVKKMIWYLNSQVDPNDDIVTRQTRPFQQVLGNKYKVIPITKVQQCNNSDCGVFSAAWVYIFLFYENRDINQITCRDMLTFRKTMLRQVLLFFRVLYPKSCMISQG